MKTLLLTLLVCIGTSLGIDIPKDFPPIDYKGDFPPIPRVMLNSTVLHKCNAFFYESTTLITTASCVSLCPGCPYQVVLSNKELLEGQKVYEVIKVEIHPNYTANPDKFNVAKLFLNEPPPNAVVFKLAKKDVQKARGTLPTWRYDNNRVFGLQHNPAVYVSREIYYRATGVYLREYQIGVKSSTPVTIGPYDEGTPFFVKLNEAEPFTVFGFMSKPKTQAHGRFFGLMSVPYFFHSKFLSDKPQ